MGGGVTDWAYQTCAVSLKGTLMKMGYKVGTNMGFSRNQEMALALLECFLNSER